MTTKSAYEQLLATEFEATPSNSGPFMFIVRPKGALGTAGFSPVPWEAHTVRAKTAEIAAAHVKKYYLNQAYGKMS